MTYDARILGCSLDGKTAVSATAVARSNRAARAKNRVEQPWVRLHLDFETWSSLIVNLGILWLISFWINPLVEPDWRALNSTSQICTLVMTGVWIISGLCSVLDWWKNGGKSK